MHTTIDKESQQTSVSGDIKKKYASSVRLSLVMIGLCAAVFCVALDNTIVATAIPLITDQFYALDDVGWYGSAYLLTICTLQLPFGKLYGLYSIKWIYIVAVCVFEIGSLVCGVAPNSVGLILGRAVAGVGAAGIFSGSILIISDLVSLERRPLYIGLLGAMYGIASVAGPFMGGVFTDHLSRRWCFYINLPFGGLTLLLVFFLFTSPQRGHVYPIPPLKQQVKRLDLIGTTLIIAAAVCLLLALQWGGSQYSWSDRRIIILLVLFAVFFIAFVTFQIWQPDIATIPPRVFKNRNVWGSSWFIACLGASFFIMIYYLPIWFQAIKGASAMESGIMNLPMVIALIIFSIFSAFVTAKTGYYTPFMLLSPVLISTGAGLITTFQPDTPHSQWIGYQVIYGAGVGMGLQQAFVAVQSALSNFESDIPIGTSIITFSQVIGGAIFISIGQTMFSNKLTTEFTSQVAPLLHGSVGGNLGTIMQKGATVLKDMLPPDVVPVFLSAYNAALMWPFYVAVALGGFSIFGAMSVEWRRLDRVG